MEFPKNMIQITSYLVGLHSFRKDHNYGNYKANLINDIQSLFSTNFDTLKVGGIDILKIGLQDSFEIRLTPNTFIYQEQTDLENIISNAKQILEIWIKYSPNVKLSLIGLVINFEMAVDKPIETNRLRLKEQYFKDFHLGKKLIGIDFRFNYRLNFNGHDYKAQLAMSENDEKDYILEGSLDFHETTENKLTGLLKESCDRIFRDAKDYFETDLFKFFNFQLE
jgi:hypothetical protein